MHDDLHGISFGWWLAVETQKSDSPRNGNFKWEQFLLEVSITDSGLNCFRSSTFCGAQEWLEVNAFVTLSFSCCIKFVRCFGVCGGVCVCWVSFFLGSYKKTWLAYCGVLSLVSDHSEPPAQQAPPHQWWIQYRPSLITVTERYFLSWELVLKWSDSSGKFYQVTFKPVGSSWTTWWLL